MEETNNPDDSDAFTPPVCSPTFQGRPKVYTGRILCQICFTGCLKKNVKRNKFEKITNLANFKAFAERWKMCDHMYNKVHSLVDWNNTDVKMAHKACKGNFFKESYLSSQHKLEDVPESTTSSIVLLINDTEEDMTMTEPRQTSSRRSLWQSCTYISSLEDRKCIICNEIKYAKGRVVPLLNITLRKRGDDMHEAEKTLREFAKIHLESNNETYKDSAHRILLTTNVSS